MLWCAKLEVIGSSIHRGDSLVSVFRYKFLNHQNRLVFLCNIYISSYLHDLIVVWKNKFTSEF